MKDLAKQSKTEPNLGENHKLYKTIMDELKSQAKTLALKDKKNIQAKKWNTACLTIRVYCSQSRLNFLSESSVFLRGQKTVVACSH
ncbi:TPA: hypothetical protein ACHTAN_000465 [Streptococcus pyogenes]